MENKKSIKKAPKRRTSVQTVDKRLFSPEGGRIALFANERIAEFLDFAIQVKFAYVNKLHRSVELRFFDINKEKPSTARSSSRVFMVHPTGFEPVAF